MDNVLSLIHNWGPQGYTSEHCPLNLNEIPEGQLSRVSFLLGGVGDGTS
jgi:hypothetical protein